MKPHYHINVFWSDEDGLWIADVPDLKYCSSHGETPEEAIANIQDAIEGWIETARESGLKFQSHAIDPLSTPLATQLSRGKRGAEIRSFAAPPEPSYRSTPFSALHAYQNRHDAIRMMKRARILPCAPSSRQAASSAICQPRLEDHADERERKGMHRPAAAHQQKHRTEQARPTRQGPSRTSHTSACVDPCRRA